MAAETFFMTKSPRKNVPDAGIELKAACIASRHASDRATSSVTSPQWCEPLKIQFLSQTFNKDNITGPICVACLCFVILYCLPTTLFVGKRKEIENRRTWFLWNRRSSLFNPYLPNILFHPYQLDESIFNFRDFLCIFSFLFYFQLKCLWANSAGPEHTRLIWGYTVCLGPKKGTLG